MLEPHLVGSLFYHNSGEIKKLVAEENARKPLSDNVIANLLKDEGIDVARRTVAKYRESLRKLPSSSERE